MNSRQRLNQIVLAVTGKDIRLVGNWEPLADLSMAAGEFAELLDVSDHQLRQCRDISDILDMMESSPIAVKVEQPNGLLF